MPKLEDEIMEALRKARKSGKDLDPGIMLTPKEGPNEELNKLLGAPKGTIIKPVPMPSPKFDEDKEIDIGGMKIKPSDIRPPKVTKDGLMLLKSGGKIDLAKCKVNTVKKNSSSSKW